MLLCSGVCNHRLVHHINSVFLKLVRKDYTFVVALRVHGYVEYFDHQNKGKFKAVIEYTNCLVQQILAENIYMVE